MGNIFASIFQRLFGNEQVKIVIQGLDAAGKTTILYKLKLGQAVTTIPTIGFNVETVTCKNIDFVLWDTGGGDKIRPLYRHYYPGAKAIIFVVDSTDRERVNKARDDLIGRILLDEELWDAVFLIFANKQDIPGAMTTEEITEKFDLAKIAPRKWHIQPTCAPSGEGLHEGLEWLATQLAANK